MALIAANSFEIMKLYTTIRADYDKLTAGISKA